MHISCSFLSLSPPLLLTAKMRPLLPTALLALISLTPLVQADYSNYDYSNQFAPAGSSPGNQSIDYIAPWPPKYRSWYGAWRVQLEDISSGVCNLSLAAYQGDTTARAALGPVRMYCWTHSNCILQTIPPHMAQSLTGASILLGLMPTILSLLGLSVAEMALLHMHRPLLSVLLSLSAPAVYPGRFLIWEDPLRANESHTGAWVIRAFPARWAVVISIAQYVLALAAIALNVHNAWTMGVRAVLVWYCDASYWPLLWVILSIVIHTIAVLSLRIAIRPKRPQPNSSVPPNSGGIPESSKARSNNPILAVLRSEFTISANSATQVRDHYSVRLGPFAVVLQYIGALAALIHLIFGTAMFSSLLYIGNGDAIPIVLRFMAAAIVSRVILQFEIGGMIRVGEDRAVWNGIVQPLIGHGGEGRGEEEGERKRLRL